MDELKELLDRQQQCIKTFLDRVKSTKKAPMERRTQEKLSEKQSELRLLWLRIVEHNKRILEKLEMPPEFHDAFNEAKAAYLDVRKWIAAQVPSLWISDPMDRSSEEVVEASGAPLTPEEGDVDKQDDKDADYTDGDEGAEGEQQHMASSRSHTSSRRASRRVTTSADLSTVLEMLADNQTSAQRENMETRRELLKLHQTKNAEEPLDMFDGDMTRYTAFRKTFQRYFDQRADLGEEDKVLVLRRHLTGYAFQRIEALMIREGSLALVWLALDESFDNREKAGEETVVSLYPGLLKEKPVPRSYETLRDLSLRFHAFLTNIELLNLSTADMGYYLCIYQMDSATRARCMDQVHDGRNEVPTGESVLKFIDKEMLALKPPN